MNRPALNPFNTEALTCLETYKIGVDIGGTNVEIGLVDRHGRCFHRDSLETMAHQPFAAFLNRFLPKLQQMLRQQEPHLRCEAMGIAVPGAGSRSGTVRQPSNFNWQPFNMIQSLRPHFDFPVHVINDANAAAIGEKHYGLARDLDNFIMITLGTGLGGGVFVDGKPLLGNRGWAGEFGHTIVEPNGRLCGCGKRGCLETYVSATGLRRTVMERISFYGRDAAPFDAISFNDLTARTICERAEEGHNIALEAFDMTGRLLGRAMADMVPLFDPQAFFLFGGLTQARRYLLEPLTKAFEANLGTPFHDQIPIHISQVPQDAAAILGACHIPDYT